MARWISLIVLLAIIAVTVAILYKVMAAFLLPLFLASVLTVIFRPVHVWILPRTKNRDTLAAAITTTVILLTVLVPMGAVFTFAVREGMGAASGNFLDRAQIQLDRFRAKLKLEIPFRRLRDPTGEEADYFSRELDHAIGELPDALPRYGEFSEDDFKRLEFLDSAFERLHSMLVDRFELAGTDEDPTDDSPEMRCAKYLRGADQDLAVEDAIWSMREMLHWVREFARSGNSVLSPELTPEQLAARFDDDGTSESEDIDAPSEEQSDVAPSPWNERPANLAETTAPTESQLRRQFAGFKSTFEATRIDMMGGPMWAGILHLANPDLEQIESWRLNVQRYLRSWLPSVAGQATAFLGSVLLGLAIMTLAVFYFLKDGPAMTRSIMRLSPLEDKYERELLIEFDKVSRAVVLATLLSAVAQGLLAGIAYFFAGFESVFLLTSLTIVLSMVPFVGAAAIWLPACLWLGFVEERLVAALVMFVYCFGVVSMADNIIKPYVLHGQSKLHPLLALLSVLGGVQALGPIGILVGPMVVSFLQALLNILHHELKRTD